MEPAPPGRPAEDGVEIRLLGPVEVTSAATVVPLGGPRLRALFGLLALRAPAAVSRDALVDGVWDADPPRRAAATLRAHIAYLRRRVEDAGLTHLIHTGPGGYALAVPAAAVDAGRFEQLWERGRCALVRGSPASAVHHLRAAQQLWRGEVLAGCPVGDWARAEAARLAELRLVVTEELMRAELALGRYGAAVAELQALVVCHPLRERLWELLIRALHLDGRPADAVRTYLRVRRLLRAELGIEPGPRLRALHAAAVPAGHNPTTTSRR